MAPARPLKRQKTNPGPEIASSEEQSNKTTNSTEVGNVDQSSKPTKTGSDDLRRSVRISQELLCS